MLGAAFKSHIARMRCPKVCVAYEPKKVLPLIDLVSPMLMFNVVRRYPAAVKSSKNPSTRSANANQLLNVVRRELPI